MLLGVVKSAAHLDWILAERRYQLRLGSRRGSVGEAGGATGEEASARLLILYGPPLPTPRLYLLEHSCETLTDAEMRASGYSTPRGDAYLCVRLGGPLSVEEGDAAFAKRVMHHIRDARGAPVLVSWLELLSADE